MLALERGLITFWVFTVMMSFGVGLYVTYYWRRAAVPWLILFGVLAAVGYGAFYVLEYATKPSSLWYIPIAVAAVGLMLVHHKIKNLD